ncbi:EAL domain-containing protein [Methylobacterium sp. A54F]
MARIFGRHVSLLALGLLGLVLLAPLAVFAPLPVAYALAALGLVAGLAAHLRLRGLVARCEKLSAEVGVLSERLIRAEAAAKPAAGDGRLAADVEDVTVEIGLLSGIVRDLAAVVSTQDGEIARLKADPRPSAPVLAVHAPVRAPVHEVSGAAPPDVRPPAAPGPTPPVAALPPLPRRPLPPRPPEPEPTAEADLAADPDDEARDAQILEAFDGDGLEVHLQPVVTLPQRKVSSYEALARLRAGGQVLAPEAFLPALERHGRTTDLDRRMLQRVATVARHLAGRGSAAAVAYGLSPRSLFEPGFLRALPRLVALEPGLSGRLVVALPQESWRSLDAEQAGALAAMRGRIGFTLDRASDLRFDAAALAQHGVTQVKVPAELLLRPGRAGQALADIATEDLVAALGRAGIRLVAAGIERESDVPDLIDLDVPFGQGGVFAPPRPVRADVLAAPPAVEPPPPEPAAPEPQRRPFRDFLRRAG